MALTLNMPLGPRFDPPPPSSEFFIYSYGSVITACANAGEVDLAVKLFGEMLDAGVKADSFTYNSVATAFAKDGQWRQAIATFKEMSEFGFRGDVFSYTASEGKEGAHVAFFFCHLPCTFCTSYYVRRIYFIPSPTHIYILVYT